MIDYNKLLSDKVQNIKPSGIRKFFDIIDDMKGVISLTIGQPDFVTPWHIREAAIESLETGKTYYTSNSGLMEMREEINNYLTRRFGISYNPKNEILVTIGGSEAIDLAIRALVNNGDEVIIPVPSYVCYDPITTMAGGVPVLVQTYEEDKFKLTPEGLKKAITNKTKLLVLPYPNNPTGAIMTRDDLEGIAEVLRGTDIMVLSDEIYAELTYNKRHVSFASIPDMYERTIFISGFSKAYAMTGWRLGYIAAAKEIIAAVYKIHQYAIMCTPTQSQYAAIEALREGDPDIESMASEYNRRRKYILSELRRMGIQCFEPEGAFYVFPNIRQFGMTSDVFCERLLYEEGVAIVPGNAFGSCGEGFARISYAYSMNHIAAALEKIESFIKKL
jgi:aminotransferase